VALERREAARVARAGRGAREQQAEAGHARGRLLGAQAPAARLQGQEASGPTERVPALQRANRGQPTGLALLVARA